MESEDRLGKGSHAKFLLLRKSNSPHQYYEWSWLFMRFFIGMFWPYNNANDAVFHAQTSTKLKDLCSVHCLQVLNPSMPGWCCILDAVIVVVKINPTKVLNEATFSWDFFLGYSGLTIMSVMLCFMCKQVPSWKNNRICVMFTACKF